MIDVTVTINRNVIFYEKAVNISAIFRKIGMQAYRLSDGRVLRHRREKGAMKLVIKMLKASKPEQWH